MASFEQRSAEYYSSSLDKLDHLLELQETELKETAVFRDDLLEKLEYLEKGGDLHDAIININKTLSSIVSGNALRVIIAASEAQSNPQNDMPNSASKLAVGSKSAVYNTTTNISGGSNFVISSVPDASNFANFATTFPNAINAMIKALNKVNNIEDGTIDKFNRYILEFKKVGEDGDIATAVTNIEGIATNLNRVGRKIFQANMWFWMIGTGSAEKLGKWFSTLSKVTAGDKIPDLSFMETVSETLLGFGLKLLIASKMYGDKTENAALSFGTSIETIMEGFREVDSRKLKEDAESVNLLKKTLLGFGITLLLAAPLYGIAMITSVPFIATTMAMIGLAFRAFPDEKKTREASRSLFYTGLGIITLAGAFVVWDKANFDAMNIGASLLTIGVVGTVFALIGAFGEKQIKEGATAVMLMGASIVVFAASMAIFNALLGGDPMSLIINVGMVAASVAALGLVYYGLGTFSSNILLGSLAVGAIGLSLIPLAFGMNLIMGIDWDWEKMAQFGTTLLGLGLIYAGAGLVAPLIVLGAISFGLIGSSLMALHAGMEKFMGMDPASLAFFTDDYNEDGSAFESLMVSLGNGAAKVASFTNLLGAGAMAGIGLALQELSAGIKPFVGTDNLFVKAINEDLGGTIATFLEQLTTPFIALAQGKSDPSGSLMGLVFGADMGLTDAMQGARSVASMGSALQAITTGIAPFTGDNNQFMKALTKSFTKPDGTTGVGLGAVIGTFITELTTPFIATLGGESVESDSLIGKIFGADFSMSKVQAGASSVASMGGALQSISDGIKPFVGQDNMLVKALTQQIKMPGVDGKMTTVTGIGSVIGHFITALTVPFQTAAGDGASNDSWMSAIFGADFSMNKAEEGAISVKAMGDALVSIGKGIKPFVGDNNPMKAALTNGLAGNIAEFISAITVPFNDLVSDDKGASNNSLLSEWIGTDFSMSNAQEGAEAVIDMGTALGKVGDGANKFWNGTKDIDLDKYKANLQTFIADMPNTFSKIMIPENMEDGDDKVEFFDQTLARVMKGVENVTGLKAAATSWDSIAKSFASIATSTATMSNNINSMDVEAVKEMSTLLFNAKEFVEEADNTSLENAVDKLGTSLMDTVSAVGAFLSGDDESAEGTAVAGGAQNKALTKKDMVLLIKTLKDSVEGSNERVIAELERVSAALTTGTINVRESNI